jgi:hypothetical protein
VNHVKVNATFAIRNDGWNELTSSSTLSVTLALNQTVRVSRLTCLFADLTDVSQVQWTASLPVEGTIAPGQNFTLSSQLRSSHDIVQYT